VKGAWARDDNQDRDSLYYCTILRVKPGDNGYFQPHQESKNHFSIIILFKDYRKVVLEDEEKRILMGLEIPVITRFHP
jgi:hypothetical protein